jgi:hypothetical protein
VLPRSRLLAAAAALVVSGFAVPAAAQAAAVSVRVEAPGGPLVPKGDVTLPSAPVPAAGVTDGHTCPGNSVIGALDAATKGDWSGVWSDATGWSIQRIKSLDLPDGGGRKWVVYVNDQYLNDSPCSEILSRDPTSVLFYPACTTATTRCFSGEPLILTVPATGSPGIYLRVSAFQISTVFNSSGIGSSTMGPAVGATITGPDGSSSTDIYGLGVLLVSSRGPQTISVASANRVPDRGVVCITDGGDGYCGTQVAPTNPFDPLNYCVTTGNDGECGTVDTRPPVGRIAQPVSGKSYSGTSKPDSLQGTVDHDHSEVNQVKLALKRQLRVTVKKYVKKRVRVRKKVRGKIRRVVVRKRVPVKRTVTRCYYWSNAATDWKLLKSCTSTVPLFSATGGEYWKYDFTSPLPAGTYTLDAQATDGVGNVDSVPELGRNRATFTVK